MQLRHMLLPCLFLLLFAAGCSGTHLQLAGLELRVGRRVDYRCGTGERITATYFTLSDRSLDFVKLTMPDNKEYTLPRAVSASGARYTDGRELVWWTKGDTGFSQGRDAEGNWQITYRDCKETNEK